MQRRHVVDYLTMALIWGSSFLLLLRVVEAFGWAAGVTLRCLIVAAVLWAVARASGRRLIFGSWRPLAVVGLTTVAGQLVGLNLAVPRIGTSMAAIFVATIPLMSMVIGHVWRIEHVDGAGRLGLVFGFAGVVLLVGFPAVQPTVGFALGCAASLASALCAAIGSNYARKHLSEVGSWEQTTGAFLVGGLVVAPLMLVVPIPTVPRPVDYLYLLLLAVVCSALAYVLYFRLVAEVGATIAISVEFLVTVIAVAIGTLFLGEHLSPVQLVGGVAIVAGCALVLGLGRTRSV